MKAWQSTDVDTAADSRFNSVFICSQITNTVIYNSTIYIDYLLCTHYLMGEKFTYVWWLKIKIRHFQILLTELKIQFRTSEQYLQLSIILYQVNFLFLLAILTFNLIEMSFMLMVVYILQVTRCISQVYNITKVYYLLCVSLKYKTPRNKFYLINCTLVLSASIGISCTQNYCIQFMYMCIFASCTQNDLNTDKNIIFEWFGVLLWGTKLDFKFCQEILTQFEILSNLKFCHHIYLLWGRECMN